METYESLEQKFIFDELADLLSGQLVKIDSYALTIGKLTLTTHGDNIRKLERDFFRAVRAELLAGLRLCDENQQLVFKKIYATPQTSIEDTVDLIYKENLKGAMQHVARDLGKKRKVK